MKSKKKEDIISPLLESLDEKNGENNNLNDTFSIAPSDEHANSEPFQKPKLIKVKSKLTKEEWKLISAQIMRVINQEFMDSNFVDSWMFQFGSNEIDIVVSKDIGQIPEKICGVPTKIEISQNPEDKLY